MNDYFCFKCKKELIDLESNRTIARSEECPHCFIDLHCCKMCHFHDINSYNECKEPISQRIVEKEKANFCDMFKIKTGNENLNSIEATFSEANSLFKN